MTRNVVAFDVSAELHELPSAWKWQSLGSLTSETISYGIVQPGSDDLDGVPIVRVTDIRNQTIDRRNALKVAPNIEEKHSRTRLRGGELLLSVVGTLGETAIVPPELKGWNVNRAVSVLRFDDALQTRWVQLCLRLPVVRHYMETWANTTVQKTFNLRDVARLPIPVPPLAEQKAIVAMLGALEDKIELNRRMNATLEAMAQALFQSWFVDFDPVRAKLDGRQPTGLDSAAAAFFPDDFEDSKLGLVPKGWMIEPVGEVVACVGGGTPSTVEPTYWEGGTHHWATPKDFSSLHAPIVIDTERRITDAGVAKISSGVLPAGTLLMSSRAPVGYLAIAAIPIAINQGFIAMKPNERASSYFMLNWCRTKMPEIQERATGTTFAEISKHNFRPIPIVVPPSTIMNAFNARVSPFYSQITKNLHQSRTLGAIRDALLPRLLSGALCIR